MERFCTCGENRLGIYTVSHQRRVGKPTAWGHVHTKTEHNKRCLDCKRVVENAWKDFWRAVGLSAKGPPNPQLIWRPSVHHPQLEHCYDGASWAIRLRDSHERLGWLIFQHRKIWASSDRQYWAAFDKSKAALAHLLFIHETPL